MITPEKFLEKHLTGQTKDYKFLVAKAYLVVLPTIFTKAHKHLIKGIFSLIRKKREQQIQEFLEGSKLWGLSIVKMTKSRVVIGTEMPAPEKGHLIFLNHVNEMDFPYDCLVIRKPYLANQVIKKTLFAYWWMKAMGSEVFDNSKAQTIAVSVKNLIKGLKDTSFIVYPEGRNTYTEEIQPLKKGMIKLAFDHKIPIFVALKSGIASFQSQQKGNTIAYITLGTFDPTQYPNYETLQEELYQRMKVNKQKLDKWVASLPEGKLDHHIPIPFDPNDYKSN